MRIVRTRRRDCGRYSEAGTTCSSAIAIVVVTDLSLEASLVLCRCRFVNVVIHVVVFVVVVTVIIIIFFFTRINTIISTTTITTMVSGKGQSEREEVLNEVRDKGKGVDQSWIGREEGRERTHAEREERGEAHGTVQAATHVREFMSV